MARGVLENRDFASYIGNGANYFLASIAALYMQMSVGSRRVLKLVKTHSKDFGKVGELKSEKGGHQYLD